MIAEIKILYLCDFDLSRNTGKERATRQKLNALNNKVSYLKVISNQYKNPFLRLLSIIFLDLNAAIHIILKRPDWFISRGYAGFISMLVAKFLGVVTIREIHANAIEESNLLPYTGLKLRVIKLMAHLAHRIDIEADVRIFNHPDLLTWYQGNNLTGEYDFYTYNGFDPESRSDLSKSDARKKFGFTESEKIIVFVGAASKWHGVDYLIELQQEFVNNGDGIKIVFGGGNTKEFDPHGFCKNFTPLDDIECAQLIRAADFCALTVRSNRVSPGSPLKLYDYIANERFILAQSETNGYSDQVELFSIGSSVDFTDSIKARKQILDAFNCRWPLTYPKCKATWSDRMDEWVYGIYNISTKLG